MPEVLLVSMPFGALDRQALGLSLLKAQLVRQGLACDVRYLTFPFAEFVGYDDYQWMTYDLPHTAFAGDWCFAGELYGERPEADEHYIRSVLRGTWQMPDATILRIQRIRSLARSFLTYCQDAVPWGEYSIVGFTSTFEQNLASLAMARRIKEAWPETRLVFGGANWEGDMGLELHRQFPFVDVVCSGEAEESFPALVRKLLSGEETSDALSQISGLVYRAAVSGESVSTGPPSLIRQMDALPIPDYTDYFSALSESTVSAHVIPHLLFETSRGCWWGAKSHCTFCGLNGSSMVYRSKTPARAFDELVLLKKQWSLELVEVVDNILDHSYFRSFLPAVADADLSLQLFYEVKSNLTRAQVALLRQAGVTRIQPGVESLSDRVLKLMRKGTTGLRNIQLLKWCLEYGIRPEWNLLYGFPGEQPGDYETTRAMLPAIAFLPPPGACGPVRLDRFSPYFQKPEDFGIREVRPVDAYRFLYPVEAERLSRIAYYFDFAYDREVTPKDCAADVIALANEWQERHRRPGEMPRASYDTEGCLIIEDSRADATFSSVRLGGLEQLAYELCDQVRTVASVVQALQEEYPESGIEESQVVGLFESLVTQRLMVTDGKYFLSLAVGTRPPSAAKAQCPRPLALTALAAAQ